MSLPDKTRVRRSSAVALIILGAVLILLAPETWPGALLLALGVMVELVGTSLSHHRRARLRKFNDSR